MIHALRYLIYLFLVHICHTSLIHASSLAFFLSLFLSLFLLLAYNVRTHLYIYTLYTYLFSLYTIYIQRQTHVVSRRTSDAFCVYLLTRTFSRLFVHCWLVYIAFLVLSRLGLHFFFFHGMSLFSRGHTHARTQWGRFFTALVRRTTLNLSFERFRFVSFFLRKIVRDSLYPHQYRVYG